MCSGNPLVVAGLTNTTGLSNPRHDAADDRVGYHWGLGVAMYHDRGRAPLIRSVGTYGWGGAAGTTYLGNPA